MSWENIENRDNEIYRTYFEANPIPQEQRRAGFGGESTAIQEFRRLWEF